MVTIVLLELQFLALYHADADEYESVDIGVQGTWVPWIMFAGSVRLIELGAPGRHYGVYFLPSRGLSGDG